MVVKSRFSFRSPVDNSGMLDDAPEGKFNGSVQDFRCAHNSVLWLGFRTFPTSAISYTLHPLPYKEVSHPEWTFHLVALQFTIRCSLAGVLPMRLPQLLNFDQKR